MKKLIMVISLMVSLFTFSKTLQNGQYRVEEIVTKNDKIYEMTMLVRNNKIVTVSFDVKNSDGKSIIFGNKNLMDQRIKFTRCITAGKDISSQKIFENVEIEKHSRELFEYLTKKSEMGETGHFFK